MSDLKRIAQETKGIRKYFVLAIVFVGIETLFEVLIPLIMAQVIDQGILAHNIKVFVYGGVAMGACALLSLLTGLLYARFAAISSTRLGQRLRNLEFERIQKFTFTNLDHFETSGIITRLTSDVTIVQNAITSGLRPMARGPIMLVLGLVMSFLLSWKLSLIFFVVSPLLVLILVWIVKKVSPQYPLLQSSLDEINRVVQENLIAIRTVKAFVKEKVELQEFDEVNAKVAGITEKTFHYALFNTPAFQLCMYATIVSIMLVGSNMILQQSLQVGDLTGILSYVLQILNSFVMLSNVFLLLTRSMASIQRIAQILKETLQSDVNDPVTSMDDATIEFKDVRFKYSANAQEYVLDHINARFEQGWRIGIVGGTGSGKTSLVSLIPRLYDVDAGAVCIGGINVKDYDLSFLREQVGIVLQNNVLFSGTILENLKWGNPDASLEEINWACKAACVDEFLPRLDQGLNMRLSQGGTNVSGGQRQRLCIARALLKHPKILIFDDSTSAVDTKTDCRIRSSLAKISGMTQIIIAQRVLSVQDCDLIVVMENGTIASMGSHEQLLKTCAIYREIYESQQKGGEEKHG